MNTTTSNKKVSVYEEVSPDVGLTEAEIKAGIWNSPPATKVQGRYMIQGKTIAPAVADKCISEKQQPTRKRASGAENAILVRRQPRLQL